RHPPAPGGLRAPPAGPSAAGPGAAPHPRRAGPTPPDRPAALTGAPAFPFSPCSRSAFVLQSYQIWTAEAGPEGMEEGVQVRLRGIRGAITVAENSEEAILDGSEQLLAEILRRNRVHP